MGILHLVPTKFDSKEPHWGKTIYQEYKGSELVFNNPKIHISEDILNSILEERNNPYILNCTKTVKNGNSTLKGIITESAKNLLVTCDKGKTLENFLKDKTLEVIISENKTNNSYYLQFSFKDIAKLNFHLILKEKIFLNNCEKLNTSISGTISEFFQNVQEITTKFKDMDENNCDEYNYKISDKSKEFSSSKKGEIFPSSKHTKNNSTASSSTDDFSKEIKPS